MVIKGRVGLSRKKTAKKALKQQSNYFIPIGSRLSQFEDANKPNPQPPIPKAAPNNRPGWFQGEVLITLSWFVMAGLVIGIVLMFPRIISHKKDNFPVGNYYSNIQSAWSDGELQKGWIPRFIPDGSTDIHEKHFTKSDIGWLCFDFPATSGQSMTLNFDRLTPDQVNNLVINGTYSRWWPDNLNGKPSITKGLQPWSIYKTNRRVNDFRITEYIAIDWKLSRAYLWRQYE